MGLLHHAGLLQTRLPRTRLLQARSARGRGGHANGEDALGGVPWNHLHGRGRELRDGPRAPRGAVRVSVPQHDAT